ncbi:MAG: hypothetical protein QNL61_08570 [Crocinitomicaceae bacterium]
MRNVSVEEVEFILSDIEARGVVLEDLRDNLLDHMCCIIEDEMNETEDFKVFYESVLPRFFKESLLEIQVETDNLIKFKNFYSMKKIMKISGIATVFFTIMGAVLKTMHLPGAGMAIVLGGFTFSLIFLPLLIAIKFKDEESKVDKAVFSFGFLIAIILSAGLIFKIMHWPFANVMMLSSTVVFTFVYVPVYFFTRVRRAELRFNTIVNSVMMMACGGIFFTLFDLSFSREFEKQMVENHIYLHQNSDRLLESNDRLYNAEVENAKGLHMLSKGVNEAIEKVTTKIEKYNSTASLSNELSQLEKAIEQYEALTKQEEYSEIRALRLEDVRIIDRINVELAKNTLARMQQQLAVNENCYLTSILSAESK